MTLFNLPPVEVKKKEYSIHNTVVVPYIIAGKAANDFFTDKGKVETAENLLVIKAEKIYSENQSWRKQFDKARDPRDFLYRFMMHWCESINQNLK